MYIDRWQGKIDAYVDAELPEDEMDEMNVHLRNCRLCASDWLVRVQLKRVIQTAGKRFSPSSGLRERIQKQLRKKTSKVGLWTWMPRLAVAAAVLIFGVLIFHRWSSDQQGQMLAELADLHVTTLASSNPVDVVSSDRQTVKPWFEGKLPFTFELPELGNSPFTLVGGRLSYIFQMPGAQLIFGIGNHRVSVFIFQNRVDRRFSENEILSRQLTFNVEAWGYDGLRYVAIGDASPDDIAKLCNLLRSAAKT